MKLINLSLFFITVFMLSACSYMKRKGNWGEKAFWPLSGRKISDAFVKNIKSPYVWGPLAGAGAIQLSGYDKKISDWASEKTPVYGTQKNASVYSDEFNKIILIENGVFVILTPSWNGDEKNYMINKLKGGTVTYLSISGAEDFNNNLKKYIKRERPNATDLRSFPSGHSTFAGGGSATLRRNIQELDLPHLWKVGLDATNSTIAGGVLWARVEAKAHYPTDVLVGYGIGNFISGFIFDSLMNLEPYENIAVYPNEKNGMTLSYLTRF